MKFQIEGYETMSPEEKVAALEAYELDLSGYVAKATFDKTASELAAAKKAIREKMSEDEAKKAAEAEERAALIERAEKAERLLAVSGYEKAYIAMGYDEKLAKAAAEALAAGDMDNVFKYQKANAENREKAIRTALLKETPPPAPGKPEVGKTREEVSKMTLLEKQKFARENPEAYKEIYGGN
jgi:hypothetical protein